MTDANRQYPPVVVVDDSDNEIGSALLTDVWKDGLYHRIVAVFIEDDLGRMLLQLRGPNVKVYPNCWDQAAGGHVDEGCSYDQAAANEVAEELGLLDIKLTVIATYRSNNVDAGRTINQFERVYSVRVPHDIELHPEATEISKLQWFTPPELKSQIAAHPDEFTAGLRYVLGKYFPLFV